MCSDGISIRPRSALSVVVFVTTITIITIIIISDATQDAAGKTWMKLLKLQYAVRKFVEAVTIVQRATICVDVIT